MMTNLKFLILIYLLLGLQPLCAQEEASSAQKIQKFGSKIAEETVLDKKLAMYKSAEVQALIKGNPSAESYLSFTIAFEYIARGDKENTLKWMKISEGFAGLRDQVDVRLYEEFQKRGDHQFVIDVMSNRMDSIAPILWRGEDKEGQLHAYYTPRLSAYMTSKIALKAYTEAYQHLSQFYKYCGNKFMGKKNYYQYAEVLQALGKDEEAITVFAKYSTEKINFGPEIKEISQQLMDKIPGGEAKFATEVAANENKQREHFQQLIGSVQEINGVDLKDRVAKSKYILLDFWGSWCAPCAEAHPKLVETYTQYKDLGFEVIGLAAENGSEMGIMEEKLRKEIERQGLPWLQTFSTATDRTHPSRKYIVLGYPTKILVDQSGKVLARLEGAGIHHSNRLDMLLAELLGDEETKYRAEKIRLTEEPFAKFNKTEDVAEKVRAYADFMERADLNVKDLVLMQEDMAKELALRFAQQKQFADAKKYYQEIKTPLLIGASLIQLLPLVGEDTYYSDQAKALMDKMLVSTLFGASVSEINSIVYVQLFAKLLNKSNPAEKESIMFKYGEALWSKLFLLDRHAQKGATDFDYKNTLTYQLAKVYAKNKDTYVGAHVVLSEYLKLDSNYDVLHAQVIEDFKELPELIDFLDKRKPLGTESNQAYLHKLMLKKDINNHVNGMEAIKGKYVLVDFWGSWCAPCRVTHPHLKSLYEKYKPKGLEIVSVAAEGNGTLDIKLLNWKTAVQADKMTWLQLLADDRESSDFDPIAEFKVNSFPTKVLFDKDYKIIGIYSAFNQAQLDAKLKEIFSF